MEEIRFPSPLKGIVFLFLLLSFSCCGDKASRRDPVHGDTIPMEYARNLTLIRHDGYTEVLIRNPWDTTAVLHRYALVGEGTDAPPSVKEGKETLVRVPLRRAGIFTGVHCELVKELGCESSIRGICEIEYIYIASIRKAVREGRVANFGMAVDPDIEKIMEAQPDGLLISPFENTAGYGRVERLGIPVIECADYMEISPLARAEWVKLYGLLFGCYERADSLFRAVEERYLSLRDRASRVGHRPTLVAEKPYSGVWYVPGGNSAMGVLYRDAGARYLFGDRKKNGSLPLSVETVFEKGQQADIWLIKYNQSVPLTLNQLISDYPPFASFRSVRSGRVYGCNLEKSRFYEETPFHPDLLLGSLVQIIHPELGIEAEKAYFYPLE